MCVLRECVCVCVCMCVCVYVCMCVCVYVCMCVKHILHESGLTQWLCVYSTGSVSCSWRPSTSSSASTTCGSSSRPSTSTCSSSCLSSPRTAASAGTSPLAGVSLNVWEYTAERHVLQFCNFHRTKAFIIILSNKTITKTQTTTQLIVYL